MSRYSLGILLVVSAVGPTRSGADTLRLRHGDEIEGQILEVRQGPDGIDYIWFKSGGVYLTVPGNMIREYTDVLEPTETPIPTPSFTPTFTPTLFPTFTRPPQETATPAPPPPVGDPVRVEPPPALPPPVVPGGQNPPPEPLPAIPAPVSPSEPGLFSLVIAHLMGAKAAPEFGFPYVLAILSLIAYLGAWILCTIDGFRQSPKKGLLMLVSGPAGLYAMRSPILRMVAPLVYMFTTMMGDEYKGDEKIVAQILANIAFWLMLILRFIG